MSADYNEHRQRMIDAARETNFALWNAMLTLDGVIASVFSAVAIFDARAKIFVMILVSLSILSAAFLVMNFAFAKYVYRLIGSTRPGQLSAQMERFHEADVAKRTLWCERRERACFLIFSIEAIIVFALVCMKNA